jgi:hypothetical protein
VIWYNPGQLGGTAVLSRLRSYLFSRGSVPQDWVGALPSRHMSTFTTLSQRWNSTYVMGSVALDSALELRKQSNARGAARQARVAGELLNRLADELLSGCHVIEDEARHLADVPAVEPLDPADFRSASILWPVTFSRIFQQVAFGARNRFFYKVRTVERIVESLAADFSESLGDLRDTTPPSALESWDALERIHNDLNVCLRESEVVLKSFLRALTTPSAEQVLMRLEVPAHRRRRPSRHRAAVSV